MAKTAVEKKKRVEATALIFKCKICKEAVPSTKINIANTYPKGELEIIHACDTCMPIVDMMEARRKVDSYDNGKQTKASWESWLNSFNKGYPYIEQIKEILRKEKKID